MLALPEIQAARRRIADAIYHSPCPHSHSLSRLCNADIYCKLDHLQVTGSFKERGARNKLKLLIEQAGGKPSIVAASAGNHALALAYHGQDLGVHVTVVMPRWAPLVKVSNCRSFGAEVIQHGESYDDARLHALELAGEKGLTFVHGFDDRDIIAGQGTLGLEILEDVPDVEAVIVPVGGGGLIAGIGSAIKAQKPNVRIIGVEARNAPTMHESFQRSQVTRIAAQPTLADGLAIAEAGKLCFEIAREVVDEIVLVSEGEIATAVLRLLEREKIVQEGAGATPLAAAISGRIDIAGKKVVLLLCGGNIDVSLISRIIERGLAADGRLARFTAYVSDRPGSLARLLSVIAAAGASVKEVYHDRNFAPPDVALVAITCIVETRDAAHVEQVHAALAATGINFR